MGGQGIERRTILRYIGLASVASTFPGFQQWTFACSPSEADALPATKPPYRPLFFSPRQFQLVDHLTGMIIPADDTPGAREAGVAEFIDFMVANRAPINGGDEMTVEAGLKLGTEAQQHFLAGLGWLDAHSHAECGQEFLDCTADQQSSLLSELAYKTKFKPTTETGRDFFQFIRDYTVVGYYTTRIGLESLGYAGLKTFWKEAPGCTHPDDPEHACLQELEPAHTMPFHIV